MNRRKSLGLVVAVVVLALAYLGWSFFKPPEEASGPIEAEPVSLDQPAASESLAEPDASGDAQDEPAPAAGETTADEAADAAGDGADAAGSEDASDTSDAASAPSEAGAEDAASDAPAPAAGPTVFEILPGDSVARFEIDEVLRGAPTHVVGTTDQVAGQIALDAADTASAQVGEIAVNVRTLATDSEFRDRAIKNRILLTDQHEYVRFRPTAVSGLPASLAAGETVPFEIAGDLEVTGVVLPVTFAGELTLAGPDRLEGSASTTLRYADFGLVIPASRSVDAVEDELILALDFVATAQP